MANYKACPTCKHGKLYVSMADGKEWCANGYCSRARVKHLTPQHRLVLSQIKQGKIPAVPQGKASPPLAGKV